MSDLKILLWDLDGTLVRTRLLGGFKDYTVPMLESVFGTAGSLNDMHVSGMTDLQIVEEALKVSGITREGILGRREQLLESYIREMKRACGNGAQVMEALPGARTVLEAIDAHPRYRSALLTGNVKPAAYLKLELTGLSEFFQLPGAFGDESFDRRDLPALAVKRINEFLDEELPPENYIVVGDTPNDIACARHFGTRVVAVATGHMHPAEVLKPYNPDALLTDLTDVDLVIRTLDEL